MTENTEKPELPKVRVRQRKTATEEPAVQPVSESEPGFKKPDTAPKTWPNGSAVFRRTDSEKLARKAFQPDEVQPGFIGRSVALGNGKFHVFAWRGTKKGYQDLGVVEGVSASLIKLSAAHPS